MPHKLKQHRLGQTPTKKKRSLKSRSNKTKDQLIGKSNLEKNRNKKRSSKGKRPTSGSLRKSNKKDKKPIS